MMHSIVFSDGTLYPAGSADHKEGQMMPTVGDTYKDWFLIPSSRPTVAMPATDAKFTTLPAKDGDVDFSTWLRKDRPAYRNRTGSFEFQVENDNEFWMTIFPKIYNSLHGRKFKMVLEEDDPAYYYEGRFAVRDPRSEPYWSTVQIEYNLQPWKRRIRKRSDTTIWDTFNFEADYDYDPWDLGSIILNGNVVYNLWGDGYPFQYEISCSHGSVHVNVNGEEAMLVAGETKKVGHAKYGMNTVIFNGTAIVGIDWRGGSL